MPGIELDTLLSSAAVLLGFQITAMGLRLQAELQKSRDDIMWLNCSDALNIAGMLTTVIAFVAPTLATCNALTEGCVAVGVILSGAFALSLMGHYDIYPSNRTGRRIPTPDGYLKYCTEQEAVCIALTAAIILAYDAALSLLRGSDDNSAYVFSAANGLVCVLAFPWRSKEDVEQGIYSCLSKRIYLFLSSYGSGGVLHKGGGDDSEDTKSGGSDEETKK
mmetsp:Transcript_24550/g.48787  ORF Transcript_24550/g.48787 Transcript_24550/m.48787 type:complete len:220 (-) Transcript_24550:940-1599(-)